MKKVTAGVALLIFISSLALAQVKSPEQFLGYKLGNRYTPHFICELLQAGSSSGARHGKAGAIWHHQ